jgi:hypothetical protein
MPPLYGSQDGRRYRPSWPLRAKANGVASELLTFAAGRDLGRFFNRAVKFNYYCSVAGLAASGRD